jgi:hypothetical protein
MLNKTEIAKAATLINEIEAIEGKRHQGLQTGWNFHPANWGGNARHYVSPHAIAMISAVIDGALRDAANWRKAALHNMGFDVTDIVVAEHRPASSTIWAEHADDLQYE